MNCQQCQTLLRPSQKKFCSRNCSAIHNNRLRLHTCKTKEKISAKLRGKKYYREKKPILTRICKICNTKFQKEWSKIVCSKQCQSKLIAIQLTGKSRGPMETYRGFPVLRDEWKLYRERCNFKFTQDDISKIPGVELLQEHGMYSINNKKGVVRDHIFSIRQGFLQNVDPTIIRHPANCQFISIIENTKKGANCYITLDELKLRISEWESKQPLVEKQVKIKHKRIIKSKKPLIFRQITITRNGILKMIPINYLSQYKKGGWYVYSDSN